MGIARFEANLLIATVQHRVQREPLLVTACGDGTNSKLETCTTKERHIARIVLLTTALLTAEFFVLRFAMHAALGS